MLLTGSLLFFCSVYGAPLWDSETCLEECPELAQSVALLEALVLSPKLAAAALSGSYQAGYKAVREDKVYSCVAEKLCGTCLEESTCTIGRCIVENVACRALTDFTSDLVKICYCSIGYNIAVLNGMVDPQWSSTDPPFCEGGVNAPQGTAETVQESCRDFSISDFIGGSPQTEEPTENAKGSSAERSSRLRIYLISLFSFLWGVFMLL